LAGKLSIKVGLTGAEKDWYESGRDGFKVHISARKTVQSVSYEEQRGYLKTSLDGIRVL
jgi:hypothetical protein